MKTKIIPKSLEEVWEWKEAVYKETKNLSLKERISYSNQNLTKIVKEFNLEIKTLKDGNIRLVKK